MTYTFLQESFYIHHLTIIPVCQIGINMIPVTTMFTANVAAISRTVVLNLALVFHTINLALNSGMVVLSLSPRFWSQSEYGWA